MGIYLNPGKKLFSFALNTPTYVDKTALIAETNALVNTERRFLCVSRPRRFGKSMTVSMLCAYYGFGADSRSMFEPRLLGQLPNWDRYLGTFNVIRLVMTQFVEGVSHIEKLKERVVMRILEDLHESFPEVRYDEDDFPYSLRKFANVSGRQFVFIIDEWDFVFRMFKHDLEGQREYLNFLRNWLKDQEYVAMAYMTGILPVKKYGQHSALNMFDEYSMTAQKQFAPYTGFTAEEVQKLCKEYGRSYEECQKWYDGYRVSGNIPQDAERRGLQAPQYSIYAPLSVVNAIDSGQFLNYWNNTETYEALAEYIRMDFDGLKETVAELMAGAHLPVSLGTYQNDMTSMTCRDDVLALLIHLGYLGYDQPKREVFIPNHEILDVFDASTRGREWKSTFKAIQNSRRLVDATMAGDAETIAELIEAAHDKAGNRTYNSEAALSYAIQLAYYAAQDDYTLIPELDTGKGFADLVYIPKHPDKPVMLIELKYDKDADTALQQIQRQRYPSRLEQYRGNIILVGINYTHSATPNAPDFKHHSCQVARG